MARDGLGVARARLGEPASIATAAYGEPLDMGGVRVSLHPAGHILGSAQVRLEHAGRVWVASGDYKVEPDDDLRGVRADPLSCVHQRVHLRPADLPLASPAGGLRGHRRVVAGQPRRGPLERAVCLRAGQGAAGARRAGRDAGGDLPGPIYTHGAVEAMNRAYRDAGVALPATTHAAEAGPGVDWSPAR